MCSKGDATQFSPEDKASDPTEKKPPTLIKKVSRFVLSELGVSAEELADFRSFSQLLHSPRDPSGLAVTRMLYGALMCVDVMHERGLSTADDRWGDPEECRFPLFASLRPLPLEWMVALYALMLAGAVGISLGWHFKKSCLCFLLPYWYVFLLDKSRWNNHSYLFGLLGTHMLVSSANRGWCLDARNNPEYRNKDVPLWNYFLLRGQIFLVYFIAGLKKTNMDWLSGYSMEKLGYHWVFDGFRLLLTDDQITLLVVHVGGFLLDLTVGFFMVLRHTRPLGFLMAGLFNLMNSRMFSIGMFPYVMIAVMPIFCSADWPKKFVICLRQLIRRPLKFDWTPGRSDDCVYEDQEKPKPSYYQNLTTLALCGYFLVQAALPYSHPLTPGLNGWTEGLYGYSWDMMVHNWRHVHTTITVVDRDTGERYHLDPEAFTRSHRWSHHAGMVKQLATCLEQRMRRRHGMRHVEIYVDVWVSLNRRFTQRMYDPTVDVVRAPWSPFSDVWWALPLQTHLTPWREGLVQTEEKIMDSSDDADVLFVADFPGFHLLNFISDGQSNTSLKVMRGSVELQFQAGHALLLEEGQQAQIPSDEYHQVSPLKHSPACYMYVYNVNRTIKGTDNFLQAATCPVTSLQQLQEVNLQTSDVTCRGFCWSQLKRDIIKKIEIFTRSTTLIRKAFISIVTQKPMVVKREKTESSLF
ncbi:hypothetical protein JTE90_018439 [Oedothorax gibbosus]|uniref:HTTM-like domain-containing protein n=1 Tax=Oedothorax gibbosus TaxID=931172 RepID=A0AAV6UXS0_9ARAC|nr:hypothetical protein JTE90_018439 [Oedothorax gibbosus]